MLPLADCLEPCTGLWFRRATQNQIHQCGEARSHISENRNIRPPVLADLCRIDLEVNHPGPRRKGVEFAGDSIIKTGSDSNQQIAVSDGEIGIGRAVHAEHAESEWMVFIEGTLPH